MPPPFKLCVFGLVSVVLAGTRGDAGSNEFVQAKRQNRPNASGRERPPMPAITRPVMFNTPEADRILAALQVYPPDNPWNADISQRPLHPNSERMIASVGAEKHLAYNLDM